MAIKPVKRAVSPTLHPANITGIPGYEEHKGYVATSVTALDAVYQSIEHVMEARAKLARDESRTQKAQVLMAAQLADKYMEKHQRELESCWNKLTAGINHTEAELTKPLEEYAGIGSINSEIRAHFKSMKPGERVQFLSEAMERGDERTLKSVLGAPSYLSGMSEAEAKHLTRNYHTKINPKLAQRLEVMKKTREKLEQAKPIILSEMEKAVGATRFELDKLRAASSEAEAALILKEFTSVEA